MTISIAPPIIPSGNLQTVTASPANGAAIIPLGSTITTGAGTMAATASPQSLLFHPEAFICAMADLDSDLPGAQATRVSDNEMNMSLRLVQQYQIGSDQKGSRIDCLYGFKEFRPDWACRVWG
jgi:hypothetical protein